MVGGGTYNKESERAIIWNDPDIGIDWGLEDYGIDDPTVSEKDANAPSIPDEDLF